MRTGIKKLKSFFEEKLRTSFNSIRSKQLLIQKLTLHTFETYGKTGDKPPFSVYSPPPILSLGEKPV